MPVTCSSLCKKNKLTIISILKKVKKKKKEMGRGTG